ncbi:MAG TPA: class I SAM-dependent methyltransferase [Steroidobacteraceae bacterium]|jgi:2-polyprenyl-3-methyl-5-hydroxy-6-metoxy-1,4-benzoquinol methylase
MTALHGRDIAENYLPSRYHYWYARSKLATDPLYAAVQGVFRDSQVPLLDIGCGIGLLPLWLKAAGCGFDYLGLDIDAGKIDIARSAVARAGLSQARFEVSDLAAGLPAHSGSVAILDVLQYLAPASRDELLACAARCVAPEGKLVIRAGLDDRSWRAAITRFTDKLGHLSRWMSTAPQAQPTAEGLTGMLARHGLHCEFTPLSGNTPFNNWLVIARRQR